MLFAPESSLCLLTSLQQKPLVKIKIFGSFLVINYLLEKNVMFEDIAQASDYRLLNEHC